MSSLAALERGDSLAIVGFEEEDEEEDTQQKEANKLHLRSVSNKSQVILKSSLLVTTSQSVQTASNSKWETSLTKMKAAIVSVFFPASTAAKSKDKSSLVFQGSNAENINLLNASEELNLDLTSSKEDFYTWKEQCSLEVQRPRNFPIRKLLPPLVDEMSKHRPTLVLDLDETLSHSVLEESHLSINDSQLSSASNQFDLNFKVFWNWEKLQVRVRFRPHLKQFLQQVSKRFEVVVFTASLQQFASPVLDAIDPEGNLIAHRLFRESCTYFGGFFVKDLDCLNRNLQRTLIVDNSPNSYLWHRENALPIRSWYCDENDCELLRILKELNKFDF